MLLWNPIGLCVARFALAFCLISAPLKAVAQSVITSEPTRVTLIAAHESSGRVRLTASVTTGQGSGIPGGTIQFVDETTMAVLGWAEPADPSIIIDHLVAGRHRLRADYSGSSDYLPTLFLPGRSQVLIENVLTVPEVALSSSSNPSAAGQLVTLMAVVIGHDVMPTGKVTFRDGWQVIADVGLDRMGAASFTTSALSEGERTITAEYHGDRANMPAVSRRLAQDVDTSRVLSSQLTPRE